VHKLLEFGPVGLLKLRPQDRIPVGSSHCWTMLGKEFGRHGPWDNERDPTLRWWVVVPAKSRQENRSRCHRSGRCSS
jgi:hypothetical protein